MLTKGIAVLFLLGLLLPRRRAGGCLAGILRGAASLAIGILALYALVSIFH